MLLLVSIALLLDAVYKTAVGEIKSYCMLESEGFRSLAITRSIVGVNQSRAGLGWISGGSKINQD